MEETYETNIFTNNYFVAADYFKVVDLLSRPPYFMLFCIRALFIVIRLINMTRTYILADIYIYVNDAL